MALQESLNKFKQQQGKFQSTLTSIASLPGASSSSKSHSRRPTPSTVSSSSSLSSKAPTPAIKFSNDTERLQHINSIRKAPIGDQIKRVIDLLLECLMALQESLNKFKQQQGKVQSTLTSIASRPGASLSSKSHSRRPTPAVASSLSCKAPTPAIKFSNDTERLQHINSIRKAPVGAQIKRVIDLLLETRRAFTAEQINEAVYVDINGNKAVFDSLRNNPKVRFEGRYFSYKSKHDLKDRNDLLHLIRKFPEGIAVIDLKDAYLTIMEDLQSLKGAGQIWLLSNFDSQEDIAYPNDPRVPLKVDDDLKQFFRGIELPRDMIDVEKDLQKNGMKPATNTAKRRAMAQIHGIQPKSKGKKKPRDISKRTKLTNAHLPELFRNLNVPDS